MFLARNTAIRDEQKKNLEGEVRLEADRNTISAEKTAVSIFNSNNAVSEHDNLTVIGGVALKAGVNAIEALGKSRVTIRYRDPTHAFTLHEEHPEIKGFLGDWIPESDRSSISGNIIGVNSQIHIIPDAPANAKLDVNSPLTPHGGTGELALSPGSTLTGALSKLNVYNNGLLPGRTGLALATDARWRVHVTPDDPHYLNTLDQLSNEGNIELSGPGDHGSRLLWVSTYEAGENSSVTMKLSTDPMESDFLLVKQTTPESRPSMLRLVDCDALLENLPEDGRVMFATAAREASEGTSLFKDGQEAFAVVPEPGALTTQTLKVERHPVGQDRKEGRDSSGMTNGVTLPELGLDEVGNITSFPRPIGNTFEGIRQTVLPKEPEAAGAFNYFLVRGTREVEIVPVVTQWLEADYALSIGRMDTLSKRRGELVRRQSSPLWMRGAYYKAEKKTS